MRDGEYVLVEAKAVLLATGGGPTMYRFHTPSGDKSCDGMAMALSAGLPLRDMEMVQFHPTGLLAGAHTRMTGTVLEEGLRGAGGYLLGSDGERHGDYDSRGARDARYRPRARSMPKCVPATTERRSLAVDGAPRRQCANAVQGHGRALRRLRLRSPRTGRGSSRQRTT
jgi:succinate dehydrogenase/fumarate reductase flavoprotein subunit